MAPREGRGCIIAAAEKSKRRGKLPAFVLEAEKFYPSITFYQPRIR